MDHNQLIKTCENIEISITEEEIENIERITRKQSNEKQWFQFREFRENHCFKDDSSMLN